jgi:hypothetical protein
VAFCRQSQYPSSSSFCSPKPVPFSPVRGGRSSASAAHIRCLAPPPMKPGSLTDCILPVKLPFVTMHHRALQLEAYFSPVLSGFRVPNQPSHVPMYYAPLAGHLIRSGTRISVGRGSSPDILADGSVPAEERLHDVAPVMAIQAIRSSTSLRVGQSFSDGYCFSTARAMHMRGQWRLGWCWSYAMSRDRHDACFGIRSRICLSSNR